MGRDPQIIAPGEAEFAALRKDIDAHKYSHGHALVLSGGPGRGGAARLAARGALRIGAGLVTLVCPPAALPENAARLDAIMIRVAGDARGLAALLEDDRVNAFCLGPGMGLGAGARTNLQMVLASGKSAVLDADALTLLARDRAAFRMLHAGCILSPHGGEFARLFPGLSTDLEMGESSPEQRADIVRAAAAEAGCVVVLKGAETLIADPSGRCGLNRARSAQAAPWLATAGSGDVLAGFITGLLARGWAPFEAAGMAVWLHAECARAFGPGLIAEDLPEALPGVFRKLVL
ncbi:MAG: NAD(P)H-hydrate dehydratase [Pseudorhodobacter sp.]